MLRVSTLRAAAAAAAAAANATRAKAHGPSAFEKTLLCAEKLHLFHREEVWFFS
jgi:hypothetical protein